MKITDVRHAMESGEIIKKNEKLGKSAGCINFAIGKFESANVHVFLKKNRRTKCIKISLVNLIWKMN